MINSPLISVIIPTYNRAHIIGATIESVNTQTYTNWELIIVDDGSTDDTEKVVMPYSIQNNRISFQKRNPSKKKGANACRNQGIVQAQGKYIALLDSDDFWPSEYLLKSVQFAENQAVFHGSYSSAKINSKDTQKYVSSRQIQEKESALNFLLSEDGFAPTPSFFLEKKAAAEILFDEDLLRHQDWDFFIRFHNSKSWLYNQSTHVIINWEQGVRRNVDFDSCIRFYERYKNDNLEKNNRIKYLKSMFELSVKNRYEIKYQKYYKYEILKHRHDVVFSGRDYLVLFFPRIFYFLHKIIK